MLWSRVGRQGDIVYIPRMEGSVVFVVNLEHSVSVMVSQPGEPIDRDAPIRCHEQDGIPLQL